MHESATLPLLLKELRLSSMSQHWERLANEQVEKGLSCTQFLKMLCELEVNTRYTSRIKRLRKASHLPTGKILSNFDFLHTQSINRTQVEALVNDAQWIKKAENLLIFGPSGVGKSHLASAIGHGAIAQGLRVYFANTGALVQELQLARKEFQLPKALLRLSRFDLLILDDIGYVKKDNAETHVLFDLIAERYESGSLLITANQPFSQWDQIFQDNMMAVAAIDRLVHHAAIINIEGESYRKVHAKAQITQPSAEMLEQTDPQPLNQAKEVTECQ